MPLGSHVATRAKHTRWELASRNVKCIDCVVFLKVLEGAALTELVALGRVGDHLDFSNFLVGSFDFEEFEEVWWLDFDGFVFAF